LFFVGHDAGGLFAMSMQCTHKGCVVVMAGEVLDCPCHQARFDRDGNVLRGPAVLPLRHFALFVDGAGNISVDRFTTVTPSTRTAL
jgi:Rieske Fe-S protein